MDFNCLNEDALKLKGRSTLAQRLVVRFLSFFMPVSLLIAALYSPSILPNAQLSATAIGELVLSLFAGLLLVNFVYSALYPERTPLIERLHTLTPESLLNERDVEVFKRAVKEVDRAMMNINFSQALALIEHNPRLKEKHNLKIVMRQQRKLLLQWVSENPDRIHDMRHFLLACIEAERRRDELNLGSAVHH